MLRSDATAGVSARRIAAILPASRLFRKDAGRMPAIRRHLFRPSQNSAIRAKIFGSRTKLLVSRLDAVHPVAGLDQGRMHQATGLDCATRGGDVVSALRNIKCSNGRSQPPTAPWVSFIDRNAERITSSLPARARSSRAVSASVLSLPCTPLAGWRLLAGKTGRAGCKPQNREDSGARSLPVHRPTTTFSAR